MKRIKKGLLFLPLVAMGISLFAGLSANKKAEKVSAEEEYTIIETEVERVYTKWGWLTFSFDIPNGGTVQESPAFAFADFNTRTSPYLNGDSTIPAFDPTTVIAGYYIAGDANSFWSAANPAYSANNLKAVSSITIPAGTEFPSRGTVAGDEKVKYVVKTSVTFYNLSWSSIDYEMTKDVNVNFVDIEVETFSNNSPNPSWPAFKLSVNDYSTKANQSVLNAGGIYNYLYNVNKVTNTAKDGKVYDFFTSSMNVAYTNFNDACANYISFGTTYAWGNDFMCYKVVEIPKGTIFPSWEWQTNIASPTARKTLYRTTKDVVFFCNNAWGSTYTRVEPTFVDATISSIANLNSFEINNLQYTNFSVYVDGFDSSACAANTDAKWAISNLFSSFEFYSGETLLDPKVNGIVEYSFGAQLCNYQSTTSYLFQIQTDGLATADKAIVRKGAIFPTPAYLGGTSNNWYRITEDQTLINIAGVWGSLNLLDKFVDTYMKLDTVTTTDPGTGKCISEGWYAAAKAAYNALPYGDKILFFNNARYTTAATRLINWAAVNGDSLQSDASLGSDSHLNAVNPTNNSLVMVIVAISMVSTLGVAILLVYKKRKQER